MAWADPTWGQRNLQSSKPRPWGSPASLVPAIIKAGSAYMAKRIHRQAYRPKRQKSSNSSNSSQSTRLNTYQNSTENIYVRRKASRRRIRSARKYRSSILKVINSNLSDRNYRRYSTGTSTSGSNTQAVFSFSLMGINGSTLINNDINQINLNLNTTNDRDHKFQVKSAFLDMTIAAEADNESVSYLDLYYVVCRRSIPNDEAISISDDFEQGMLNQSGSTLQSTVYGVTPFQSSKFCQNWLITRVQRVQLSPGQVISGYQMYGKLRTFNSSNLSDENFALRGVTRGILAIHCGGPGIGGVPTSSTITFNTTRNYSTNVLENNSGSFTTI